MARKRVTLVIDEELDKKVEVYAALQGEDKRKVIEDALEEYLNNRNPLMESKLLEIVNGLK